MPLWPFNRRKRKGARPDEREEDDENIGISTLITGPEGSKQRRTQVWREAKSSSKSRSRQVSNSQDPDLASPLSAHPVPRPMASATSFEQVSSAPETPAPAVRPPLAEVTNPVQSPAPRPIKDPAKLASKTSLQRENVAIDQVAPTLNHKRSRGPNEASRQKSTKRRAEEKDRLRELRAMSIPIPVPNPRRRASAQATGPTAAGGQTRNLQRPMSEISLPLAESLRSSFSGTLELSSSYRVSPFDSLSPRPTIRYSELPQRMSESAVPSRTATRKDKGPAIPEEDFSPRARIDNLADDLDARALRQVMEREQRRKERKAKAKLEKVERERRQKEAQKQAASKQESSPPVATDQLNDIQMHDADAAGPSTAPRGPRNVSPSPMPKQRSPPPEPAQSPSSWLQDPSEESLTRDASPMDTNGNDDKEEPVLEMAQVVRLSSANMAPPSPAEPEPTSEPATLSVSMGAKAPHPPPKSIARELARDDSTKAKGRRRDSDSGSGSRWKAIFRRSGTKHHGSSEKSRETPSEFSNTSRESFVRQQKAAGIAAPVVPRSFTPQKTISTSTTPRRTKSKFREDLPDFPVSPPSSRNSRNVGPDSPISPASPASPYIDDPAKVEAMNTEDRASTPIGDVHPALRDEMRLSRGQSPRSLSPEVPSAAALSQSLASVDSEGSWLSGRPPKRSSFPVSTLRESGGSPSEHVEKSTTGHSKDQDAAYFSRREPADRSTLQASGLTAQLARGLSTPGPEEIVTTTPSTQQSPTDGEPKEGRITGHRPMVVHAGGSHRSRKGLVIGGREGDGSSPRSQKAEIEGVDDDEDSPRPSPDQDVAIEDISVQQATSVDLNRGPSHSRRVSAGSARILDIPPRSGGDKRNSTLSFGSSLPSPGIPPRTEDSGPGGGGEGNGNKNKHSTMSVRSSLGSGQTQGLGLGLRLGPRTVTAENASADEELQEMTSQQG